MFETQIKGEYEKISKMADEINANNYLSLTAVFSDELFYTNFIEADARFQCFISLTQMSAEGIFNDKLYLNNDAEEWLMNFVGKFSSIKSEYLSDLLKLAVDLRFNYIIRPVTTVNSFLFGDSHTISLKEAQLKLAYFSGHEYLLISANQIIEEYSKSFDIITKSAFKKQLSTKLNNYFRKSENNEIVRLTDDIFDFLGQLDSYNLAILSLMIFFDDLRIEGIVETLDGIKENYSNFTQDDLLSSINVLTSTEIDDSIIEDNNFDNPDVIISNSELITHENDNFPVEHNLIDNDVLDDIVHLEANIGKNISFNKDFEIDTNLNLDESIDILENHINNLNIIDSSEDDFNTGNNSEFRDQLQNIISELSDI